MCDKKPEPNLVVSDGVTEFRGTLARAGVVNQNKVQYTEDALRHAVEQFNSRDKPMYGAMFEPGLASPVAVKDIAFEVKEISIEEDALVARQEVLVSTPCGEICAQLLELEKETPGTYSIGMAGVAEETEEVDGVLIVKKFSVDRVTLLPTKEKA